MAEGAFSASFRAQETPRLPGVAVEGVLGAGGHSTVYRGHDERHGVVAIKRWHAEWAPDDERLTREVEALRAVDHPGIARLLELRHDQEGRPCLLMQAVEGRSLADLLAAEGPLPGERLLALGEALLDALEHLAARGLVHRDLKPANVVLRADGAPVLVDFSVVRSLAPRDEPTLTGTGQALGTSAYMAPEQCGGDRGEISPQTDLYGLGALLFHAATGVPPWEHESGWERTQRNPWRQPYPSRSEPRAQVEAARERLPGPLGEAIAWALEGESSRRVPDAASLRAALRGELASGSAQTTSENHDPQEELDPRGKQRRKESSMLFLRALALVIVLGLAASVALFSLSAKPVAPTRPLPVPRASRAPGSAPLEVSSSSPTPTRSRRPAVESESPAPALELGAATPTETPAAASAASVVEREPLLQEFDAAFAARDGARAVMALRKLSEAGEPAYPDVARGIARLGLAGDWGKTAVLFNAERLFSAELSQWGLLEERVGVTDPKGESYFKVGCVLNLSGEPEAQLRALEAHLARSEEIPQPLAVVSKLRPIVSPAASRLVGQVALGEHPEFVLKRALLVLSERADEVSRGALEQVRDRGGELGRRAGALLLRRELTRAGELLLRGRGELRAGDLVVAVNGKPVAETYRGLDAVIERLGRPATLTILRNGAELTLRVTSIDVLGLESVFVSGR